MKKVIESIPGYSYGAPDVPRSPVSTHDLESLKISAGFTDEDQRYVRLAGEVLSDQTERIVEHWRSGIIASIPNLARHSRTPEGDPIPQYLKNSKPAFSAMDSGHLLPPLRSGLDQLSAGDRAETYLFEEEQSGWRSLHAVRPVARRAGIHCGDERDHKAIPGGKATFRRRSRQDASRVVQVHCNCSLLFGSALTPARDHRRKNGDSWPQPRDANFATIG
jgi:hypothetical protein